MVSDTCASEAARASVASRSSAPSARRAPPPPPPPPASRSRDAPRRRQPSRGGADSARSSRAVVAAALCASSSEVKDAARLSAAATEACSDETCPFGVPRGFALAASSPSAATGAARARRRGTPVSDSSADFSRSMPLPFSIALCSFFAGSTQPSPQPPSPPPPRASPRPPTSAQSRPPPPRARLGGGGVRHHRRVTQTEQHATQPPPFRCPIWHFSPPPRQSPSALVAESSARRSPWKPSPPPTPRGAGGGRRFRRRRRLRRALHASGRFGFQRVDAGLQRAHGFLELPFLLLEPRLLRFRRLLGLLLALALLDRLLQLLRVPLGSLLGGAAHLAAVAASASRASSLERNASHSFADVSARAAADASLRAAASAATVSGRSREASVSARRFFSACAVSAASICMVSAARSGLQGHVRLLLLLLRDRLHLRRRLLNGRHLRGELGVPRRRRRAARSGVRASSSIWPCAFSNCASSFAVFAVARSVWDVDAVSDAFSSRSASSRFMTSCNFCVNRTSSASFASTYKLAFALHLLLRRFDLSLQRLLLLRSLFLGLARRLLRLLHGRLRHVELALEFSLGRERIARLLLVNSLEMRNLFVALRELRFQIAHLDQRRRPAAAVQPLAWCRPEPRACPRTMPPRRADRRPSTRAPAPCTVLSEKKPRAIPRNHGPALSACRVVLRWSE